ncbi:MAG: MlaC/ttg2D family ABC transporter substrate-binding protein [Gammaproteobacteria bacterium]
MRNLTKQFSRFSLLTLLLGLLFAAESIAESLQPPQQVIQSVSEQLRQRLQDKSFTNNFARVVQFVDGVIYPHTDFDKISPLVLGKNWRTATANERERFNKEFRIMLIRTYSRAFVEYNDWTIRFPPLAMTKDASKVIVRTEVLQPGLNPVDVNYRMFLNKDGWKVYDIMIEGVSLVTNYRSTFNEQIQRKGSLSAVIDDLAKRNVEALGSKGS